MELSGSEIRSNIIIVGNILRGETIIWAHTIFVHIWEVQLNNKSLVIDSCSLNILIRCKDFTSIVLGEWIAMKICSQVNWTLVCLPAMTFSVESPVSTVEEIGVGLAVSSTLNGVEEERRSSQGNNRKIFE